MPPRSINSPPATTPSATLVVTPLAWPPTGDNQRRLHQVLGILADQVAGLHHACRLLDQLTRPAAHAPAGGYARALQHADDAAAPVHDIAWAAEQLRDHGCPDLARRWRRLRAELIAEAVQQLRDLDGNGLHRRLKPKCTPAALRAITDQLRQAGQQLTELDTELIHHLNRHPTDQPSYPA